MLLIIQIMFHISNLTNKSVTSFSSIPPLGGLALWTKLTEAYFFAIKVNTHFHKVEFGNNHYVASATFPPKNLI